MSRYIVKVEYGKKNKNYFRSWSTPLNSLGDVSRWIKQKPIPYNTTIEVEDTYLKQSKFGKPYKFK